MAKVYANLPSTTNKRRSRVFGGFLCGTVLNIIADLSKLGVKIHAKLRFCIDIWILATFSLLLQCGLVEAIMRVNELNAL